MVRYTELQSRSWKVVFRDTGKEDWRRGWMLDGEQASVANDDDGMVFAAGPKEGGDAAHAVLWTKASFSGDVKITFDYTRLDSAVRYVNILYLQAQGTAEGPYAEDIAAWGHLRSVPAMKHYFNNMDLLHISFAAFDNANDDPADDYIRARRYPTRPGVPFAKTDIKPDNFRTGLFVPGMMYRCTVVKTDEDLFFEVEGRGAALFHWPLSGVKPITGGRFGIRHMASRMSRYKNITVSVMP